MDLNKVMLIGRLTQNPEVKSTPTGRTVATFGVATGRVWTDANGVKQEKTEFSNCVAWGKIADTAGQYLTKGRQVYVEGRLQTRDWVGNDGVKRYRTEVIIENFIMLGSRPAGTGVAPPESAPVAGSPAGSDPGAAPAEEEIKVEDIPF